MGDLKDHLEPKYFTKILDKLAEKKSLSREESRNAMENIVLGKKDPVEVSAFLVLLRCKGETADEVAGLVESMLKHAEKVEIKGKLLDIVGTGGDGHDTVNISTSAAVLSAACGVKVCKHGNRSVSSKSGSADVLESLGVKMLQPQHIDSCIERANIAFMYAPYFHPSMKFVSPVRKALKVRTVFNILGPLMNPARAQRLYLGVYSPDLLPIYGDTLMMLGVEHALVVHCCGLDELAPLGVAQAVEVTREGIKFITIDTLSFGIPKCEISDLKGDDCDYNAMIMKQVFAGGEGCKNAIGDTIALNAGAALYVYGTASSIKEGYEIAKKKLFSGETLEVLNNWAKVSTDLNNITTDTSK